MARGYTCDGCGAQMQEPELQAGFVMRRDYCCACADIVRAYQKEADELHTEAAKQFTADLALLRNEYAERLRLLPDERERVEPA